MKPAKVEVDIDIWAIVKIALAILAIYLLYLIKDIIALIFVVLLLYAIFAPVVNRWAKKIRRIPAVIAMLLIIVAIISAIIYLIIPPLVSETSQFAFHLPANLGKYSYLKQYAPIIQNNLDAITRGVGGLSSGFVSLTASIFGGVVTFITAIVLFVYLLLDAHAPRKLALYLIPSEYRDRIIAVIRKVSDKVGAWFRGQLLLGLIVGLMDLIGLLIIGVPYALTLAVIAAVLEIVPLIGPIIAGIIAALVALTVSPIMALIVVALFILVQQLENNILVPNIMKKAVGLSPVIIIIAILIGARLLGIAGAMLAVPISASIAVIVAEWPTIKKTLETDAGKN
ncbi:MAG: AI-2E family transporter [Patescibacteria group bacterium]|jgi:predicted PurR-regulated permease PerM